MLRIEGLQAAYKNEKSTIQAFGPLNLDIKAGEICAIIGPSGCGKSTLLHVLGGIHRQFEGTVELKGEPLNPVHHTIGFIPQHFGLLPWKTVMENCLLPYIIRKKAIGQQETDKAAEILDELGMTGLEKRFPNALSGGQKQRVAVARAFIMNPDLLLMDEPFSALDSLKREEVQALFLSIWRQFKTTTLFVTHSLEEAVFMGKRIIVLSDSPGRIAEVIDNPVFGLKDEEKRESGEFLAMTSRIRDIVKKGWHQ